LFKVKLEAEEPLNLIIRFRKVLTYT